MITGTANNHAVMQNIKSNQIWKLCISMRMSGGGG